ncbi:MAG: hypothetical protein ACRCRP_02465 [Metamycoplasmataceae bacterium]
MNYKDIDQHMKNTFRNKKKIKELTKFSVEKIKELKENQKYKATYAVIAVDIVSSLELKEELNIDIYNKIMSEFFHGVYSILYSSGGFEIKINENVIYAIFNSNLKKDIDNILDVGVLLNTFIEHLNKNIEKEFNLEEEFLVGIGIYSSSDNYITKISINEKKEEVIFLGDSINNACILASIAGTKVFNRILFNNLVEGNFTEETKKENNKIGSFDVHYIEELDEDVFGCDWIKEKYLNYIENNV